MVSAMPAARLTDVGTDWRPGVLPPPAVGDVDDTPSALGLHLRDGHEELLVQIALPALVGHVLEVAGGGGAGVVHQDVDTAIGVDDLSEEALDLVRPGDVRLDGQHLASSGPSDLLGRLLEDIPSTGTYGHLDAFGRQHLGGGFAYSLAPPGNQGHFALQS